MCEKSYEYTAYLDDHPEQKIMIVATHEQGDTDEWTGKAAEACVKAWGKGSIIVDRTRYDSNSEQWVYEGTFSVKFTNLSVCTECLIEELGEI